MTGKTPELMVNMQGDTQRNDTKTHGKHTKG